MPHLACDQTANIVKVLADCGGTLSALASTFLLDQLPGTTLECDQHSFVRLLPERDCESNLQVINRQVLGVTSTSTLSTTTGTTTTFVNKSDPNYVAPTAAASKSGADAVEVQSITLVAFTILALTAPACW